MGDPPLRAVGLGLLSCLAAACSTSSMAAPPTRADAAIEAAVDAPPELPDCGEEFIAIEVDREGGERSRWCSPLTSDHLAVDVSSCAPEFTSGEGTGDPVVDFAGTGRMFSALGPAPITVSLQGRGLPCGAPDARCDFRTYGSPCNAVVTRAGGVGDTVEAVLRDACVMTHTSEDGQTMYRMNLRGLRIRGVLRLRYEINRPSHFDGGLLAADCSVP
jgi:hypothetical protein